MIPFDSARWIVLAVIGVLASISFAALGRQWLVRARRDRWLREKSLAQSVLQLRELFEEAPVAYHEIDRSGIIRRVNRAECRLLGHQPSALMGRPVWEFVERAQRESAREAVLRKLADEEPLAVFEREFIRRDGSLVTLEIHETYIRDGLGSVVGIRTALLDVSDRKRAQRALAESEARHRAIVTTAGEGIVMIDEDGTVDSFNPAAEKIFGYSESEMVGTNVRRLMPSPYRAVWDRRVRQRDFESATGEPREYGALRKHGKRFAVELSVSEVRVGERRLFAATIRDVTERRRDEKRLKHYARELEGTTGALKSALLMAREATDAKTQFLTNMSHEIRTPMNGVLGMTEILLGSSLDSEQRDCAEAVRSSAQSLMAIIDDILDISRIESSKLELESAPFDLVSHIGELRALFQPAARGKGLQFHCTVSPSVPRLLIGDPVRLRQVLGNLIGNAVKFTAEGEVSLRVDLVQDSGNRCLVRFTVRDTGIGIDRDKAEGLFEYFVQGDNSHTRRYGGTGLGLAIAGNLVSRMDGRISVQSEPGCGSTFSFAIPLAKQPPAEMDPETALAGAHILIAHRSRAARNRLSQILQSWGCRCEETEVGAETVSCVLSANSRGDAFRLALIESGPEGMTAAQAIKNDPLGAGMGLLAISSVLLRAERARLREIGFVGFLQEPVPESQLLNGIVEALEATRSRPAPDAGFERAPVLPFSPARHRGKPARILLAEDNEINSRIALRILERAGYQAEAVPNGKEAIAALDREAYDMVLMDVQMPEMDGLEATAIIRHQERGGRRKTPIVAMTANAMLGDRERCLAAGMDDYISKPVNIHELYRAIEKWAAVSRESTLTEAEPQALNRARL